MCVRYVWPGLRHPFFRGRWNETACHSPPYIAFLSVLLVVLVRAQVQQGLSVCLLAQPNPPIQWFASGGPTDISQTK